MHVKKDSKGKWEVFLYVKVLGSDKTKLKHKRGFDTKKEAISWAEQFKLKQNNRLDMDFESFYQIYKDDMKNRLRENTIRTKDYVVELKILPYFGKKKMIDICAADIRKWQSMLMKENYSQTYLRTINNQLSAIFNYAVKYYDLPRNPCQQAGTMGKSKADEMQFWTLEEFEQFIGAVEDKPMSYMAFKMLYWTGMRLGELLALTIADIDFDKSKIRINKSYQRIKGKDVITEPKTRRGNREVALPNFLVEELRDYVNRLYGYSENDRLFMMTKSYIEHEMLRGIEISGVKKIRVHDLRHSHASLLISKLGAEPKLVADRLGHEKIQTTLDTYVHLFPKQSQELANQLDELILKEGEDE